jgi:hypothetical protein
MFVALNRSAAVGAQQREVELTSQVVPQLLDLDRRQYVPVLPEQGHHLSVGADRPSHGGGPTHDRTDLSVEASASTRPACRKEAIVVLASSSTSVPLSQASSGSILADADSASNG